MNIEKLKSTAATVLAIGEKVGEIALAIAKVIPATAPVANAIELGIKLANGLAHEAPVALQTWNDIQAAAAGGVPVSDDQWTAWETQISDAHNELQAAAAAVK